MLISETTTRSFLFFFASKEVYLIVRQLEKITVKKAQTKVVKCAQKILGPKEPFLLGHLSVKLESLSMQENGVTKDKEMHFGKTCIIFDAALCEWMSEWGLP